ncbi:nucleolar RNA-binding Nop10p family protein [Pseudomonadota bacterium]
MAKHLLKCQECGKYSMKEKCSCGGKAINIKPPKYSPEDPYAKYRREAKEEDWKKKGYL